MLLCGYVTLCMYWHSHGYGNSRVSVGQSVCAITSLGVMVGLPNIQPNNMPRKEKIIIRQAEGDCLTSLELKA